MRKNVLMMAAAVMVLLAAGACGNNDEPTAETGSQAWDNRPETIRLSRPVKTMINSKIYNIEEVNGRTIYIVPGTEQRRAELAKLAQSEEHYSGGPTGYFAPWYESERSTGDYVSDLYIIRDDETGVHYEAAIPPTIAVCLKQGISGNEAMSRMAALRGKYPMMSEYILRNDGDSDCGAVFLINPSCKTSLELLDLADALYSEGCFMWVEPDRIGNFFHRD